MSVATVIHPSCFSLGHTDIFAQDGDKSCTKSGQPLNGHQRGGKPPGRHILALNQAFLVGDR